MTYKIHWEDKGLLIDFTGRVDRSDFDKVRAFVLRDERIETLQYHISNFLGMTEIAYSINDIEKCAHLDGATAQSSPNMKAVIVCDQEDSLALASLYQAEMRDSAWQCEFFTTLSAARAWIDNTPLNKKNLYYRAGL